MISKTFIYINRTKHRHQLSNFYFDMFYIKLLHFHWELKCKSEINKFVEINVGENEMRMNKCEKRNNNLCDIS